MIVFLTALVLIGCSSPDATLEATGLFCIDENLRVDSDAAAEKLIRACEIPIPDGYMVFTLKDGSEMKFQADENGLVPVSGVPAANVVAVMFGAITARGFLHQCGSGEFDMLKPGESRFYVGLTASYCKIPAGHKPVHRRIAPPDGYTRIKAGEGSFGHWLRRLRLFPGRGNVHLFDGNLKANQEAHYAVLTVDVGEADLQQCADAVIRLRAEYLLTSGCQDRIQFNFTSGDAAKWSEWRSGIRPVVDGNRVSWSQSAEADSSYGNFRKYLDVVFTYAGSASLERELIPVPDPSRPEIGDVFIEGGHPGHAVIVLDVAENEHGDRIFLLAQSYMPAQEIHILNSPEDFSPWYEAFSDGILRTPEWEFYYTALRRCPEVDCKP